MTASSTKRSAARAIADVTSGLILATVEIASPPERVFRALTASDDVVKWWGADGVYRTTSWEADVRVGGHWRAGGVGSDGVPFAVEGEFTAVDAPRRLAMTWKPEWDGGHVTQLAYDLEAIDGGTRLTVRHEGFGDRTESCRQHGAGWEMVLGWLDAYASPAPTVPSYFVVRLLPPRPTFMFDASPDELAVMKEHAAYWTRHLHTGVAVLFGPVNDPKEPYGLGIVRVSDAADLAPLLAADPAIQSGRGLRYESAPILRALTLA